MGFHVGKQSFAPKQSFRASINGRTKINQNGTPQQDPINLKSFPQSIDYDINIAFLGIFADEVNLTKLKELSPKTSQISRYVPLSYLFETYINYSLNYNYYFFGSSVAGEFSNVLSRYGNFSFPVDMALYWSGRTSVSQYSRLSINEPKNYLSTLFDPQTPTIFIANLFHNDSTFYQNQNAEPHTYFLEKVDIDTQQFSMLRQDGKYAPGFDWADRRWIFIDISSGPSPYETSSGDFTNFVEFREGSLDASGVATVCAKIIEAVTFSRFVPTYLYEPTWDAEVEVALGLFHESSFDIQSYIDIVEIQNSFTGLLPYSTIEITTNDQIFQNNSELDTWLQYIDSFTDYTTWASKLVEFMTNKEDDLFGAADKKRVMVGVFALDVIAGHDDALGFTYAPLGSSHSSGSVVTITPTTITTNGEGLTQTIIHEIGHSLSLRHPHDYRYDGTLYKFWTGDVSETPLSYLHSVYEWGELDKDMLHRGQYRYLFNQTSWLLDEIKAESLSRNFPENRFPRDIYGELRSGSSSFNHSITLFTSHNYTAALQEIYPVFQVMQDSLANVSALSDYFAPIVNVYNANNSKVEYGDTLTITGKTVTYDIPTVQILTSYRDYNASLDVTNYTLFLYETEFLISIPTLIFPQTSNLDLWIWVYDGIEYYKYNLTFITHLVSINIISPMNNMLLDASNADSLKIFGGYQSISNRSQLQILYGSYWYVKDRDFENSSYWVPVNKSTASTWEYTVNISSFVNGDNTIKVRIFNNRSVHTDSVNLRIQGLPQNETVPVEPDKPPPITTDPLQAQPPRLIDQLLIFGLIGTIGIVIVQGVRQYFRQKGEERIVGEDIPLPGLSRELEELKQKMAEKEKKRVKPPKKTEFVPKRRR